MVAALVVLDVAEFGAAAGVCEAVVAGATLGGFIGADLLSLPIFCASAQLQDKAIEVMQIELRIIFYFLRFVFPNEYLQEWSQEDFLKYRRRSGLRLQLQSLVTCDGAWRVAARV